MNICVDCRMLTASGVGVYLRGLLPFLLESGNRILLLGDTKALYKTTGNTTILNCKIKPFSLKETFFFPKNILQIIDSFDLFYSPYFNIPRGIKIPVFTTIHDIVFPDMPELISKTGLAIRMRFFRRAYKKSEKIFTVSEFSKSRIEAHLGKSKPVVVTNSAIQPFFGEYGSNARNIQKKETIIFIGNIKKNKGLDYLLDAFLLARNEGLPHKLIIIGSKDNFRTKDNAILKKIETVGGNAVSFTGFISDGQLMEYLSEAALLVQPSLYEGFGLPPLEAMVLGTPALISDIPVFREIYGEFPVVFFRAGDTIDLKNKLMELLSQKGMPAISLPEHLLSKYTFRKTASIVLQNLTTA